jgi:NTE family protein
VAGRYDRTVKRALVLAGGGVAGIAWELGVLRGLQDADPGLVARVIGADMVIGTSAGSAVAAQVTSGVALDDLYAAQLSDETAEIEVELDMATLFARFAEAVAGAATPPDVRRAVGALALDTPTVPEAIRHAAVAARLPVPGWPDRELLLPAVDAETGDYVVFTKDSGVALVDAVAASCAVPGVWPPVTINGRRYMDGGTRSGTNADLAAGCDRVLVILPSLADQPDPFNKLNDEIELLKPAEVLAVYADTASVTAFGTNPLSPATRPASARAGRAIGQAVASDVATFWS